MLGGTGSGPDDTPEAAMLLSYVARDPKRVGGFEMQASRRSFLAKLGGAVSVVIGGTQLTGCLTDNDSEPSATSASTTQSAAASSTSVTSSAPAMPTQASANAGPVWESSPTIEFVEGVPSMVSVRQFVRDADQDALTIKQESGALLPGITWDPSRAILAYDGRPLGAKPDMPVVVTGLTFSADDGKK